MSVWNNSGTKANWQGNGEVGRSRTLNISTINADEIITKDLYANYISTGYLEANSISSVNGSIAFLSNLVLNTGVIQLGISPTILTAEAGVLYVNGDAVAFPSSFSTIADWSQFRAVANVNMSRSSIYNVQSISTNTLSTGVLRAGSISTNNVAASGAVVANNISSAIFTTDTINARAGTIATLASTDIVTSNLIGFNISSSNIFSRNIFTSSIVNSNSITSFAISSVIVSTGYIVADVGFFNSTFNSTIFSYKGIFQSTATSLLIANNISTGFVYGANGLFSNLNASNLNVSNQNVNSLNVNNISSGLIRAGEVEVQTLLSAKDIELNPLTFSNYSSNVLYTPGTIVRYNLTYYQAVLSNLNVIPANSIPLWFPNQTYNVYNYTHVTGVGSYRCINNVSGSTTSPNGDPTNWIFFSGSDDITQIWSNIGTTPSVLKSGIVGDALSYISVGTITASNINISTIITNNISTGTANINFLNTSNIYNSNALQTNSIDVISDSQLNTLTTSGALTTNNALNLNGGLFLNSDIVGRTENITIPIPPFSIPQYFNNLDNINEANVASLTVIGGATGNNFFPPYRNNSIVNIGLTEFSPGIVTIYGVNAELTSAFTVYGITSLNGDTTVNGLNTVNGLTDLNGDLTVIGLTTITGDTDITGLTSITGNTDINGACEITGATNILGGLTVEAGIAVAGAMAFEGGDFIIGSSPGGGVTNNFNLYNYYNGTDVQNLTVNCNGDFRQNVSVVGTLTASNINIKSTTTTLANISTLLVSSLVGFRGLFNSLSTNSISTGAIIANRGLFNSLSTNNISTGAIIANRGLFNSISTNNISTGVLSVQELSTTNISADVLNFKIATGQELLFKGEGGAGTGMVFYRNVDGVQEVDTAIVTDNIDGFTILSASTINIVAEKEVNISSLKSINLNTPDGYTYAQYASTGSLYTSTINFDIATGKGIQLIPAPEESVGIVMYRDINGVPEVDTAIGVDNENNFRILSLSSITIQATNNLILGTSEQMALIAQSNITIGTPQVDIPFNANISTINTNQISTNAVYSDFLVAYNAVVASSTITRSLVSEFVSTGGLIADRATIVNDLSANNLFTTNLLTFFIGNPLPFQSPIGFNDNLNLQGNTISNTFLLQSSNISTNLISTGSLFVNNSLGNSISSLRTSTGVLFSGTVSSQQMFTSSIRTNRAFIDRLAPLFDTGTNTANLYPASAGSQIGFFGSAGTNSGGFYNQINARSTLTQVIVPDVVGAFSNNIRIQGNVSTQNVFVSSINNKLYPYTSTLNIPFSSFSITGNQAGTPILLYSNVNFRTQGFHRISQKAILSKNTGGTSADIHANIFYTVGAFPSTPSITDGYSALPFVNQDNASTFTTLMTEFYVSSPTTRSIYYYDSTANNYTSRLYLGTLFDSVTPDLGNNPTRIPSIV